MTDVVQANLWRRMRYTPLRDWIRGRLNVRLDWRGRLAESGLPEAARQLTHRVTVRTRLWRVEKADVAEELTAHFLDALAAEMPLEMVLRSFGDERRAAKLIRRSKKRNRPLAWHLLIWLGRGVGLLMLYFAVMAGRLFLTHPSPRTDYLAEINSPALSVPESERAWPLYRREILAIAGSNEKFPDWVGDNLDGKHWPDAQAWLIAHRADLDVLRQARDKSTLGFVLGARGSVNDPELFPGLSGKADSSPGLSPPELISTLLPYLNDLRYLALILQADSKLALIDKDGSRLENDVITLHQMAVQLRGNDEYVVTQLVGLGIDSLAVQTLDRAISTQPGLLSDDQLIRLAHILSRDRVASDLVTLEGDRMVFQDIVQRVFTDDGHGDGHLTAQGLRELDRYYPWSSDGNEPAPIEITAALTIAAGAPSRKDVMLEYDRWFDVNEAQLRLPLRNVDRHSDEEFLTKIQCQWGMNSYFARLFPSFSGVQATCERFLGERDGVVTGMALEMYRRRNGAYPQTLDALAPTYLPEVPADRFTGEPIKYRLMDGHPLLYSVGADRIDDGGVPPKNNPEGAADWRISADEARNGSTRGDWILYPQPKNPAGEDD